MRPKKRILLIDSDETRQSVRRYLFVTHGFTVLSAATADEAREIAANEPLDLIVCGWPLAGADLDRLLGDLHAVDPLLRSMLLAESSTFAPEGFVAHAVLLKGACSPAEILERARCMSARKRGPRKGCEQRMQPQAAVDHLMNLAERRIA
jgi:DNA-binding response OmpR family regulator